MNNPGRPECHRQIEIHPPWHSPRSARLFEIGDDRAQEARRLAAGDGAMIEGQRQRQHAVQHEPPSAARTARSRCGRRPRIATCGGTMISAACRPPMVPKFDSVMVATAQSAGVRLRSCTPFFERVDLPAPILRRRVRDIAQHRDEEPVRAVDRKPEIDLGDCRAATIDAASKLALSAGSAVQPATIARISRT